MVPQMPNISSQSFSVTFFKEPGLADRVVSKGPNITSTRFSPSGPGPPLSPADTHGNGYTRHSRADGGIEIPNPAQAATSANNVR